MCTSVARPRYVCCLCAHAFISFIPAIRPVASFMGFPFEMLLKHTPLSPSGLSVFQALFYVLTLSSRSLWSSHSNSLPFSKAALLYQVWIVLSRFQNAAYLVLIFHTWSFFYCSFQHTPKFPVSQSRKIIAHTSESELFVKQHRLLISDFRSLGICI